MATVYLDDDIVSESDRTYSGRGISAALFRSRIDDAGQDGDLIVRVNSHGGTVAEGLSMYATLTAIRSAGRRVVTVIEGVAASAATLPAMAGEVHMMDTAIMLIHGSRTYGAGGTKGDLQEAVEMLEATDTAMAAAYQRKSGLSPEKIREILNKETILTAAMAKELGFADRVISSGAIALRSLASSTRRSKIRMPVNTQRIRAAMIALAALQELATAGSTADDPNERQYWVDMNAFVPLASTKGMEIYAQADPAGAKEPIVSGSLQDALDVHAAARRLTGQSEGLVGALDALKSKAEASQTVSVRAQARAVLQEGVADGRVLPGEVEARLESYMGNRNPVADARSYVASASVIYPVQAAQDTPKDTVPTKPQRGLNPAIFNSIRPPLARKESV